MWLLNKPATFLIVFVPFKTLELLETKTTFWIGLILAQRIFPPGETEGFDANLIANTKCSQSAIPADRRAERSFESAWTRSKIGVGVCVYAATETKINYPISVRWLLNSDLSIIQHSIPKVMRLKTIKPLEIRF